MDAPDELLDELPEELALEFVILQEYKDIEEFHRDYILMLLGHNK